MNKKELIHEYYQDKWNSQKVWEVTKLSGGYYLRQFICNRLWNLIITVRLKHIRLAGRMVKPVERRNL